MKNTLILTTVLAAAFLGSGVANAAGTLKASDYTRGAIGLGSNKNYDTLVVDTPLTLIGVGYLDFYDGATIQFQKEQAAEAICSIFTSASQAGYNTAMFNYDGDVYNITFDAAAQTVVAASAGTPITLIQDLAMASNGFRFWRTSPSQTTLKLNGVGYNETVVLDGVSFTYVGPKEDGYTFNAGEIGFIGYKNGSHNLSLVANAPAVPEPTTGSLSLLALAGLCIRRRK